MGNAMVKSKETFSKNADYNIFLVAWDESALVSQIGSPKKVSIMANLIAIRPHLF